MTTYTNKKLPTNEILLDHNGISQNLKTWANQLEIPYTTILTRYTRYKQNKLVLSDVLAPSKTQRDADKKLQQQLAQIYKEQTIYKEINALIDRLRQQLQEREPHARLRRLLSVDQTQKPYPQDCIHHTDPAIEIPTELEDILRRLASVQNQTDQAY